MPAAIGAALITEIGLATGLELVAGESINALVGYAVLGSASGGLGFVPAKCEEPPDDCVKRDPEA